MLQEVGGVLVDAVCSRANQLVVSIAPGQKTDAQRPRTSCRQQVPHAIPDDRRVLDRDPKLDGGGEEQVWIGLRMPHLLPRDHRDLSADTDISSAGRALSSQPLVAMA